MAKKVSKGNIVFVNPEKYNRAVEIVALISGTQTVRTQDEAERKEKFAGFVAEAEVSPKGDAVVKFVYEKLGGLIRTVAEEVKIEKTRAASKKKDKVEKEESEGPSEEEDAPKDSEGEQE